jgi:thiazole synthase
MPDAIETLKATEALAISFIVLPYIHADPVLCKHLEEREQQRLCL